MDSDPINHPGSGRLPKGDPCGSIMDEVRPGHRDTQSTESMD